MTTKDSSLSPREEPFEPPAAPNVPHPEAPVGDGFRRWWDAYPRHVRGSMSTAMRLWLGMNLEPKADAVVAGLEAWKSSRVWAVDKKINRADRWLADGLWESPPEEASHGPDSRDFAHRRSASEDARRSADRAQRVGSGGAKPAVRVL